MAGSRFHLFGHLCSEGLPFCFLFLSEVEVEFLCQVPGSGLRVLSAKTLVKTREHCFPKGLGSCNTETGKSASFF